MLLLLEHPPQFQLRNPTLCVNFNNEEYVELLKRFNVPYDKRYIFRPIPD